MPLFMDKDKGKEHRSERKESLYREGEFLRCLRSIERPQIILGLFSGNAMRYGVIKFSQGQLFFVIFRIGGDVGDFFYPIAPIYWLATSNVNRKIASASDIVEINLTVHHLFKSFVQHLFPSERSRRGFPVNRLILYVGTLDEFGFAVLASYAIQRHFDKPALCVILVSEVRLLSMYRKILPERPLPRPPSQSLWHVPAS